MAILVILHKEVLTQALTFTAGKSSEHVLTLNLICSLDN